MLQLSKWKWIFWLSLLAVITACSGRPEGTDANRQLDDTLIVAIGSEPEDGFDPTIGWGRYGSPLFQSTLLQRNHQMDIVGDLATDYSVSEDGKEWTVQIRQDVKFSDGVPLTAEDVVFTFATAAASSSTVDLTNLERVEAIDAYTVRFLLKEPQSTFVSLLISTGIVPQHAYSSDYAERPIGSGPYQFVQWDRGQQLIVEVNPEYYGDKPYFRKVTFLFLNEDAAFAAAKAGQVDVVSVPSSLATQTVQGMRLVDLQTVDNRGIMFPYVPSGTTTEEGYPIGNDVTSDLAIRKAVNVAIDREALVEGILEGFGTPAYTANDGLPWWNPDTVFADGDLDAARRILADGGWTDEDGDGIVQKGSLQAAFTLIYPAGDRTRQSLALAVADMIRPVGIDITVEGKSWDEIEKLMHANAVLFGWGSHDPLEMYYLYSSRFQGVDLFDAGYYSNPTVDRWMELALHAASEEEANEYWQKAQWDGETGMSFHGDAAWAWLVNIDHVYFVREQLDIGEQGIHPHGHGWPITDNISQWRWSS